MQNQQEELTLSCDEESSVKTEKIKDRNTTLIREKIKNCITKRYWWFFGVGIAIFAFLCFFNLWKFPIYDWDEARHGVNAYEMLRHNNWLANYYQDEFDYWNLKPPISYWTVMIGYKIFGYNNFGLRFFSALSMVSICVIIALFFKFRSKEGGEVASIISVFLFICNNKMIRKHCARTADADAVFLLFYTIAIISLLLYKRNVIFFYLCGVCFSLMFLTKSWHSFSLVPIVFFYLLFTKGFKEVKWWQFIIFFASSIFLVLLWGVLRYTVDGTAFFKEMIEYDLLK